MWVLTQMDVWFGEESHRREECCYGQKEKLEGKIIAILKSYELATTINLYWLAIFKILGKFSRDEKSVYFLFTK